MTENKKNGDKFQGMGLTNQSDIALGTKLIKPLKMKLEGPTVQHVFFAS